MRDFTFKIYKSLLITLRNAKYEIYTFEKYLTAERLSEKVLILRHDVDRLAQSAWRMARMEAEMRIRSTYYFRVVPEVYNEKIIKEISNIGHEIGYHYEDLSLGNGNWVLGIRNFEKNLEQLRTIYPVKTICMHGSPLSRFDNRLLWEKYDYRDYGIIGEPYFDVDFCEVLYLSDTGRRWDGNNVSLRDSVERGAWGVGRRERDRQSPTSDAQRATPNALRSTLYTQRPTLNETIGLRFRNTYDIIRAAEQGRLPDKIMMTVHPQRWSDRLLPWVKELVFQNVKNVVKRVIIGLRK